MVPRAVKRDGFRLDGEPLQAGGIRRSPSIHSRLPNMIRRHDLAVREALNQFGGRERSPFYLTVEDEPLIFGRVAQVAGSHCATRVSSLLLLAAAERLTAEKEKA
jgi:hypothetical protein